MMKTARIEMPGMENRRWGWGGGGEGGSGRVVKVRDHEIKSSSHDMNN